MDRDNIYIIGGVSNKFTYRPAKGKGFKEMAYEVANDVLKNTGISPYEIDSFGLASMVPGGFGTEGGEIAIGIANEIGLKNCRKIRTIKETSSTGGEALSEACEDIAYNPRIKNSLIIGCELMGDDKEIIKKTLSSAVGERERNLSFEMMHEGDLLMGSLEDWFGLDESAFSKYILSRIAVGKYGRGKEWEKAQYHEKKIDFKDYKKSESVTNRFKMLDVVPTSNGASAIILSKNIPEKPPNNRIVRIRGIGQGTAPPSVSDRKGPVYYFQAIRQSYKYACEDACVSLEYLKDILKDDFAILHDAFPSIEIAFLKELDFDKNDIVKLLVSGKTNPCGGLKVWGHAIGASGVLQAALASELLYNVKKYKRSLITSVGGPLTNVYTSILEAGDAKGNFPELLEKERYNEDKFAKYLQPDGEYEKILQSLSEKKGIVIGNTEVKGKHFNLVQLGPEDRKELAYSRNKIDLGRFVDIEPSEEGLYRVKAIYRRSPAKIILKSLSRFPETRKIKKEAKMAFKQSIS